MRVGAPSRSSSTPLDLVGPAKKISGRISGDPPTKAEGGSGAAQPASAIIAKAGAIMDFMIGKYGSAPTREVPQWFDARQRHSVTPGSGLVTVPIDRD
jgi:hypothetical protein